MNQRNYEFLCDQLRFSGFGAELNIVLKKELEKGDPEFQIIYEKPFTEDLTTVTLYFRKSDRSELYFFTRFEVEMNSENIQETVRQSFHVHKDHHYTLREAYNLLSGRAVHKNFVSTQGMRYNVWVQLDFSQKDKWNNFKYERFYRQYGFNLNAEVEKYPFLELESQEQKKLLLASLQKGDRRTVTLMQGEFSKTCFLEANPKFKSLKIFDESLQRLSNHELLEGPREMTGIPSQDPPISQEIATTALEQLSKTGPQKPKQTTRKSGKKNQISKKRKKE